MWKSCGCSPSLQAGANAATSLSTNGLGASTGDFKNRSSPVTFTLSFGRHPRQTTDKTPRGSRYKHGWFENRTGTLGDRSFSISAVLARSSPPNKISPLDAAAAESLPPRRFRPTGPKRRPAVSSCVDVLLLLRRYWGICPRQPRDNTLQGSRYNHGWFENRTGTPGDRSFFCRPMDPTFCRQRHPSADRSIRAAVAASWRHKPRPSAQRTRAPAIRRWISNAPGKRLTLAASTAPPSDTSQAP